MVVEIVLKGTELIRKMFAGSASLQCRALFKQVALQSRSYNDLPAVSVQWLSPRGCLVATKSTVWPPSSAQSC